MWAYPAVKICEITQKHDNFMGTPGRNEKWAI